MGILESMVRADIFWSTSINVGVCAVDEPDPLTRGRSPGEGECGITRCDFLLFETIMLTAQAARSTGVRLAA
jgi:hypothetical protein